jgi:hypothetical protein
MTLNDLKQLRSDNCDQIQNLRSGTDESVLLVAETLHMMATGSVEWDPDEGARLYGWLKRKLDGWGRCPWRAQGTNPMAPPRATYDAIVFALATQARAEYDASMWTKKPTALTPERVGPPPGVPALPPVIGSR